MGIESRLLGNLCSRVHYIIILVVLVISNMCVVNAQNDPQSSMYFAVPTQYNPAAAGSDSALHVSVFDRMQWVGVKNAPRTFFVSADMPFMVKQSRHGVGLAIVNDQSGLFQTTQLGVQYSHSLRLAGGRLALGLQGGMVNQSFAGGDIYIPDGDAWDPNDDGLPSGDISGMTVDFGFGAYYEYDWLYAGISAQHLTGGTLELDEYAYTELERSYFFIVGGNIPIKRSLLLLQPSFLLKTTFQAMQYDFTLRATYDNKFWGGLTFRPGDAIVMMVGANVGSISLGYAYDIGLSPLARVSNGSHEIMATYSYKLNLDKKRQHAHKSIRIL